jgi:hypothetical protein
VRCRVPPLTDGFGGTMVVVEEKGEGSVGEGGEGADTSAR